MRAAPEPGASLYTTRTFDTLHPHQWAGAQRWMLESVNSHELYNLGHLYEAAVAHYQATGKRTLLDIALRTADLLDRTFGPGKQVIWPGHQITEMGLAKLYRATYMSSGMAYVAALTGDTAYIGAIDKIWENVAGKKLYITGGIGATGSG